MAAEELGPQMGHSQDESKIVLKSHKHSCGPNMEMVQKACFILEHNSIPRAVLELKPPSPGHSLWWPWSQQT